MDIHICSTLVGSAQEIPKGVVPIYASTNGETLTVFTIYPFISKVENFYPFFKVLKPLTMFLFTYTIFSL